MPAAKLKEPATRSPHGAWWKVLGVSPDATLAVRLFTFHCVLHLFEGAHLDLPHTFARYAELLGEVFQRYGILGQPPRLEDSAFALVQCSQRTN